MCAGRKRKTRGGEDDAQSCEKKMKPTPTCVVCLEGVLGDAGGFKACHGSEPGHERSEHDKNVKIPPPCPNGLCGGCARRACKKKISTMKCFCGAGTIRTGYNPVRPTVRRTRARRTQHTQTGSRRTQHTPTRSPHTLHGPTDANGRSVNDQWHVRAQREEERSYEYMAPMTVALMPIILMGLCAAAG